MPKSARIRPLIAARWRDWLPLAVLLATLSSVFALGGDRGYLYRLDFTHNEITVKNMAIAENMSPKHGFRLALGVWRDEYGGFEYDLYGRFPVGGYALIKLATLPFEGGLAAKLLAARVLALLMFCGAALFAYLALARIAGSRWVALAAVLLAFSSLYALHFADAVAGETAMDLFGAMLVFHGMIIFVREGRFRQLLIKTCAALLLGWHVYALIMPFALWGFGVEALALVRSSFVSGGGIRAAARAAFPALARSRFIALAAVSVLFGSALLALNFANEYAAYGDEMPLRDLPSVDSMIDRLGLTDDYDNYQDWAPGAFLRRQFHRAGVASAPYAAAGFPDYDSPPLEASPASFGWAAWGAAAAVAALVAAALVPRRFRAPMACLALMGFCWALAARGNAFYGFHSHEGMFFVGLPLALWVGALTGARRLLGANVGGSLAIGIAALAAPIFALSVTFDAQIRADEHAVKRLKEVMADMDAIREVAAGKSVILSFAAWHAASPNYALFGRQTEYYLSGINAWEGLEPVLRGDEAGWARASRTIRGREGPGPRVVDAEYAVIRYRNERFNLLTPDNRHLFLYALADLHDIYRAERRRLEASEPDARSEFDVHLEYGALRYLKSPCAPEDADAFFFAHFFPPDAAYLGGEGAPIGFDGVNFPLVVTNYDYNNSGGYLDGACMTTVNIPSYPIAAIQTGQYIIGGERLWETAIFPPPSAETLAAYESAYQTVASREPAERSGFDLHLNGNNTISYLKRPCSEEDARGRFFLSVHPANAADLPAERREIGHESLNFNFTPPRAAIFNGKCMATIQLPDYEIDRIATGQDTPDERLWEAAVIPPSAYERVYQTIASGEPAAQSGFDIYLDADGGAISYLKEPCTEGDARGRFFLSVRPADAADLPAERRALGHESLNFDFVPPRAVMFNGKCMATVQLPDYEIAEIEAGQDAPDGRLWEASIIPPSAYERAYQTIASGEPAAQSGFDLYLDADGGAISYLKRPCSEEDARGRFFLSVHPANAADLPENRRELGHESLNFDFVPPRGVIFNGKCMATIQLPDYEIAKIETGQDAPDAGRLWQAAIAVGD